VVITYKKQRKHYEKSLKHERKRVRERERQYILGSKTSMNMILAIPECSSHLKKVLIENDHIHTQGDMFDP